MAASSGGSFHSGEGLRWLWEEYARSLQQAIEGMTGAAVAVSVVGGESTETAGGPMLWRTQPFSLPAGGGVSVGVLSADSLDVGRRALQAAGIEDSSEQDRLGTFKEILQQAAAGLARALTARLSAEVNLLDAVDAAPEAGAPVLAATIEWSPGEATRLQVAFTSPLILAIEQGAAKAGAGIAPTSLEPSEVQGGGTGGPPRSFELLLDVELPVSISFGRAHLPLKEVLKLTSGSIVELNRTVTEPVEVIVNNCVIARGEVVVVQGNYGVRILEIISRNERLRTLH